MTWKKPSYQICFVQNKRNIFVVKRAEKCTTHHLKPSQKKRLEKNGLLRKHYKDGSWSSFEQNNSGKTIFSSGMFTDTTSIMASDGRIMKIWKNFAKLKTVPIEKFSKKLSKCYSAVKASQATTKQDKNMEFLDLVNEYCFQKVGAVLYLDAESMTTSSFLDEIPHHKIVINFDKTIWARLKKANRFNTTQYHGSINSWISEYNPEKNKPLAAVWLDYCCTLFGNEKVHPIEDISKMFAKGCLKQGSVFGVTLCLWDPRRTGKTQQSYVPVIKRKITAIAKKYGFTMKRLNTDNISSYRSTKLPMFCPFYKIQ